MLGPEGPDQPVPFDLRLAESLRRSPQRNELIMIGHEPILSNLES